MRILHRLVASAALTAHLAAGPVGAVTVTSAPSPNLDLSGLGQVLLTGDFDAISLYQYSGQNQDAFTTNGSQALLTQLPNGAFLTLNSTDAYIMAMCPFVRKTGDLAGIVVGGNFTSFAGVETQGAALYDPNTGAVTALTGLSGSVHALYCDQDMDTVYVGGDFKGANSTNAIAWVGMDGWTNTPFEGFNGPVNAIARAPDGKILFGGSFSGLANMTTPSQQNQQIINLSSANISVSANSSISGTGDPTIIACGGPGAAENGGKAGGSRQSSDGPGTWLLPNASTGFWRADFEFGFLPSRLRLWNTHRDGRGTKSFRFTAFPINGILNLTYTDPATGKNATCYPDCPLSDNSSLPYQDFRFVNVIGMNSFRIDITDWYGAGAGLDGIELYQDDIYTYAVNKLNEPNCTAGPFGAHADATGPWEVQPSGQSGSLYLAADLQGPNVTGNSASVTFLADIKQPGNYTVTIYTPGCNQDNSCSSRGIANITGSFQPGVQMDPVSIYQTNQFEKYDQIYTGPVAESSDSFRPSITLSPMSNQNDSIRLVALRVRYQLLSPSSTGLNGLFEFDPNAATVDTDFSKSKFDSIGKELPIGTDVTSLAVVGTSLFVAGNFTTDDFSNVFTYANDSGNATSLPNKGLNDAVVSAVAFNDLVYIGGNFTDTADGHTDGLQHVAIFDMDKGVWSPLGGGVDGPVTNIVPLLLNVTDGTPETCITVNGPFTQILASGSSSAFNVTGLAIWVPSRGQWLNNLGIDMPAISGQLTATTNVTNQQPLLAGTVSSQGLAINGAVDLTASNGSPSISSTGLKVQPPASGSGANSSSLRKRELKEETNATGINAGLFVTDNNRNITILAGHFAATASDGSTINNLAFIDNGSGKNRSVTGFPGGIDTQSSFLALSRNGDTLYAGGAVTGRANNDDINGLVVWNLATSAFNETQLPGLSGLDPYITAISTRPNSADLYIGGKFDGAGGVGCHGVCVYNGGQWNNPGTTFSGNVSAFMWQGNDLLLVAGELEVSGTQTGLAVYDASKQSWSIPNGAATGVPGPVTALSAASSDGSSYWVGGNSSVNGSSFLIKYDSGSSSFKPVPTELGNGSTISGLSIFTLTQNHDDNDLIPAKMALLVAGTLKLPSFGNASAALFNGTDFEPFVLANSGNGPGRLGQVVTEQQQSFDTTGPQLKLAYVVLIALAIALALIFLLIVLGLLIERRRRNVEGYRPAPQNMFEKTANMGRIPPDRLFGSLNPQKEPDL